MSFLQQFRTSISRSSTRSVAVARRTLTSTSPRRSATGYGDPEDEKPKSETPGQSSSEAKPPAGAESKAPKGQGGPVKSEGGKEDHGAREQGSTGGGGGNGGSSGGEKVVKETKKIGEAPKKEEVDTAGPIGG